MTVETIAAGQTSSKAHAASSTGRPIAICRGVMPSADSPLAIHCPDPSRQGLPRLEPLAHTLLERAEIASCDCHRSRIVIR